MKRDAALFGEIKRLIGFKTEDVDAGESHDRGHLVAVAVEVIEAAVPPRKQIGAHSLDQLEKIPRRDLIVDNGVVEGRQNKIVTEAAF